jgi:hypothetical protein
MNTLNKILAILVLILFTICVYLVVKNNKIRIENTTLQAAINKPAVEQKPKIVYKETVKTVIKEVPKEILDTLSEQDRAKFVQMIHDLQLQLEKYTEVSIDGGSISKPEVPAQQPVQPGKDKRCLVEGVGYGGAAEFSVGYQPLKKYDVYGVVGYHSQSKLGLGLLYRF